MTVTDVAYRQGWLACHAQISAAVLAAIEALPVPRIAPVLVRCTQCGDELRPGEPAEWVGRDAYLTDTYRHAGNCPRVRPLDDGPLYGRPTEVPTIER